MKADSPLWIVMGPSATPAEEAALNAFRELLPDDGIATAWVNLTFIDNNGRSGEIDVLLLTRAGLFNIELKGEVVLSKRVPLAFERLRAAHADEVSAQGLVSQRRPDGRRLWTWAGLRANATLLAGLGLDAFSVENDYVDLPAVAELADADPNAVPNPGVDAVVGLKFSAALPSVLAARTLGERLADPDAARDKRSLNGWCIGPSTCRTVRWARCTDR
jgi:hypothetical protein